MAHHYIPKLSKTIIILVKVFSMYLKYIVQKTWKHCFDIQVSWISMLQRPSPYSFVHIGCFMLLQSNLPNILLVQTLNDDQVLTFLFAGQDSTAAAMASCLCFLCAYPKCKAKLLKAGGTSHIKMLLIQSLVTRSLHLVLDIVYCTASFFCQFCHLIFLVPYQAM